MRLVPRQAFIDWWTSEQSFTSNVPSARRLYRYFVLLLFLCASVMAAGVLVSPDGPRTPLGLGAMGAALALIVWAVWRIIADKPSSDRLSLFLYSSLDVVAFVAFTQFSSKTLQLLGVFIYCPLAFLIGFRHGARVLVAHCAFAAAAIGYLLTLYMLSPHGNTTGLVIGLGLLIATVSMPISCHVFLYAFQRDAHDSRVDHLTKVLNRRGFVQRLAAMTADYVIGDPVAVINVDFDHFKKLNDTLGHQAGDEALQDGAEILTRIAHRASGRPNTVIARIGGDEFVVALGLAGRTDPQEFACAVADEICVAVGEEMPDPVTASVGVAFCHAPSAKYRTTELMDSCMHLADQAVYESKRAGGNRVSVTR